MTYTTATPDDFIDLRRIRSSRRLSPQRVCGAVALAGVVLAGARLLALQPAVVIPQKEPPLVAPKGVEKPIVSRTERPQVVAVVPKPDLALLDPTALGLVPSPWAQSAPLKTGFKFASTVVPSAPPPVAPVAVAALAPAAIPDSADVPPNAVASSPAESEDILPAQAPPVSPLVADVPMPVPRPPEFDAAPGRASPRDLARQIARQDHTPGASAISPDNRNFIEKFFGMSSHPAGPTLAYAAPEDGLFGGMRSRLTNPVMPYGASTAVYDIAAHTVFMPDGTKLEAHSGLGSRLDDPHSVTERNIGATPPHAYDLQPREQLFHGVRALRLNPVGGGGVFGRTGLLAHTFMLGPNGDSNGCVSFRNYNAFLQAYLNGEVRRLVVVARLN